MRQSTRVYAQKMHHRQINPSKRDRNFALSTKFILTMFLETRKSDFVKLVRLSKVTINLSLRKFNLIESYY